MEAFRDVELRHLRYFVTVSEHGSFRQAGLALGVRESAISRRMRDLEDCLGASLFQRRASGVTLTLAGHRFLHRVRLGLQNINDGIRDVGAIGRSEEGRIRIGIFSSLASGFLHELLLSYEHEHSSVHIELIDGNPAEHVASIRQLGLDVAFITGTAEWSGCETTTLWFERVFAVLPSTHRLAQEADLKWTDLMQERFIVSDAAPGPEIRDYLVRRIADFGHHPDIQPQYVGRNNLLTLVAIGNGITVTSEATTAARFPGVIYRPIQDEILPFSAVWSPHNDNPACRRLLSMARARTTSTSDIRSAR